MANYEHDTYSMIEAIAELNASIDPESLQDRLHQLFAAVLNSELITFGEMNCPMEDEIGGRVLFDPESGLIKEPGFKILFEGSDLSLSSSEYSVSNGGEPVIQPSIGSDSTVSYQIGISVAVTEDSKIEFTLQRGSQAFTDDDKEKFALLIPHIRNAVRSTQEVRRLMDRSNHYESLLSRVSRGYIRVNMDGHALEITPRAFATLKRHFDEWEPRTEQLPAEVASWLRSTISNDDNSEVVSALRLTRETGELRFSPVYDHANLSITLLIEERARISPSHLTVAGLTAREIEILQFMEAGKSDSVIAVLLDISNRTVQKHVENIFRKLNAETRTEAVHKATEIVRFSSSDSLKLTDLHGSDGHNYGH